MAPALPIMTIYISQTFKAAVRDQGFSVPATLQTQGIDRAPQNTDGEKKGSAPGSQALFSAVFCFGANTQCKAAKANERPVVGFICPDLGTQMLDVYISASHPMFPLESVESSGPIQRTVYPISETDVCDGSDEFLSAGICFLCCLCGGTRRYSSIHFSMSFSLSEQR